MNTPRADGFAMPAEGSPHAGCWMIWPERPDNWRLGAKPAQAAFAAAATAIARFEPVTMLASARQYANARNSLPASIRVLETSSNDAWARDVGPTFLLGPNGELRGVDWQFNAWGGLDGGLYCPWDLDDQIAAKILQTERAKSYRAPITLEGGAIHVDGEGTILTTSACLLDTNRNPFITRDIMETTLCEYLGAQKVIWLGQGIPDDETGGHVDNLACFVKPGVVLLSWCDDPADPHYAVSRNAEARLLATRDAAGRPIRVEHILMPTRMAYTREEIDTLEPNEKRARREPGARLPGSYVNFYPANGAIIAPSFGAPTDAPAREVLTRLFPTREIIMLPSREILLGGGGIHCITQQQPKASSSFSEEKEPKRLF
jgi:agmatine deiminase